MGRCETMSDETVDHYFICKITGIPKKIQPLVAWRLRNRDAIIRDILYKVAQGEI